MKWTKHSLVATGFTVLILAVLVLSAQAGLHRGFDQAQDDLEEDNYRASTSSNLTSGTNGVLLSARITTETNRAQVAEAVLRTTGTNAQTIATNSAAILATRGSTFTNNSGDFASATDHAAVTNHTATLSLRGSAFTNNSGDFLPIGDSSKMTNAVISFTTNYVFDYFSNKVYFVNGVTITIQK